MLKSVITAAVIGTFALPALAGNPAPAPADPVVIVEDTTSTGTSFLVPLLFLVLVANGLRG